jgi:putative DNA primase/helicase
MASKERIQHDYRSTTYDSSGRPVVTTSHSGVRSVVVPMDEVVEQKVEWLWPGFLPLGKLIVLCGDPGLGKSFLTMKIAALVSRGGPWPSVLGGETSGEPGSAIILSAEDDPADTIKPRLMAMGADLTKCLMHEGFVNQSDKLFDFVLGQSANHMRALAGSAPDVKLVVVDPVSAYVGETDTYNNAQVRAMLRPLSEMANEYGITVILVTHMKKGQTEKAIHRAMGSLAFTAAARVVLGVTKDKGDSEIRVVTTIKSNLSKDTRAINFQIKEGRVVFQEFYENNADEPEDAESRENAATICQELVERIKGSPDGLLAATDAKAIWEAAGVSESAVNMKKKRFGIRSIRKDGRWWFTLEAKTP